MSGLTRILALNSDLYLFAILKLKNEIPRIYKNSFNERVPGHRIEWQNQYAFRIASSTSLYGIFAVYSLLMQIYAFSLSVSEVSLNASKMVRIFLKSGLIL